MTAIVSGRNSTNDGGGGTFILAQASSSTNLGTIFPSSNTAYYWMRSYVGPLNTKWFGSYGNGTNDDTSSIQDALNVKVAPVLIPDGRYKISSIAIPTNGVMIGSGTGNTVFVITNLTISPIILSNYCVLSDVGFYYPSQVTNGVPTTYPATITGTNVSYSVIKNIDLQNAFSGINLLPGGHNVLIDNVVGFPIYSAIAISDTFDIARVSNCHFNPNKLNYVYAKSLYEYVWTNGTAFFIGRSDWAELDHCFSYGYSKGFQFESGYTVGGSAENVRVYSSGADGANQCVVSTNHNALVFSGCVFASFNSVAGSILTPNDYAIDIGAGDSTIMNRSKVIFANCLFNRSEATMIRSSGNIALIGNSIVGYGNAQSSTSYGVLLNGVNAENSVIIGNTFNSTNNLGAFVTYPIRYNDQTNIVISGNSYLNNLIGGPVSFNSTVGMINGEVDGTFYLNRRASTNSSMLQFSTVGDAQWNLGMRSASDNDFHLYSSMATQDAITSNRTNAYVGFGVLPIFGRVQIASTSPAIANLSLSGNSGGTTNLQLEFSNASTYGWRFYTDEAVTGDLYISRLVAGIAYQSLRFDRSNGNVQPSSDVVFLTAGKGIQIKEGANARIGIAFLDTGTNLVANTSITANTRIFLTSQADGGTPGWLRVSARTNGVNFHIQSSSATDTSTVAWMLIEPSP